MKQRKNDLTRTSRLALISLIPLFSSHHYQHGCIFVGATARRGRSNGPPIQHRVKRSRRSVDYGFSRRTSASYAPVRTNIRSTSTTYSSGSDGERNDAHRNLRRELHPGEDAFWVFDASPVNSHETKQQNYNNKNDNGRRNLLRYLYDQFVGEDSTETNELLSSSSSINNHVNTTVELESNFNSNNTHFHDADGTHIMSSNTTATTTAVVGDFTNTTGNITESVVYTTVNEGAMQSEGDNYAESNVINSENIGENGSYIDRSDYGSFNTTENNLNNSISQEDREPQFQPLRIRAILAEASGNGSLLADNEREILFYDMLSPALLAWSSSLRVDPVVGNLTVDVHQLLDGQTCGPGIDSGLPSIRVPPHHMTEGIPETDMIVYLSLGFSIPNVDNNEKNNTHENNKTDANYDDDANPTSVEEKGKGNNEQSDLYNSKLMLSKREELKGSSFGNIKDRLNRIDFGDYRRSLSARINSGNAQDLPPSSTSSLSNDLISNANETTGSINICTGDYLAAASYCSTDQYDRPTAALLHICIDDSFFDPIHRQRNIMTIIHELGHALGFNALSMAHFRRPDGTPYTPRDEDGNIPDSTIECTGPEDEHQTATLPLPSEEILKFRNVRGGVRVAEIVTPSVVQVVRNQFDCQLLTGAELESSEGSPLSLKVDGAGCIGDHWERRLFSSDVMNPIVDDIEYSTRISTLTLAYFADSGWYQVDLSNADVASGWGRGAGCNFVNDTCINEFGDVPPQNAPFFCNEVEEDRIPGLTLAQNIHGCTPDLSRKARCSIGQYDLDLPKAYQYFNFTYGSDVGGSDTLMDFCPVYDGYDNGLCSDAKSETIIRANEVERFGVRNSRCLVGNVFPFYRNTALCLPIACVLEDRSLRIKVGEDWHICDFADQIIESGNVNITCPDPRRICPTFFCPYDCLGTGGECDYNSGNCLCHYENKTNPEETVLDVCGIVEEIKEYENRSSTSAATTRRPILQRKGKIDSLMPPSDTKLSEYYVSDVLHLDGRPNFFDAWGILILIITCLALLSFVVALSILRLSSKGVSCKTYNKLLFWRRKRSGGPEEEDGLVEDGNVNDRTREKLKMVASVLVDMRIRETDNRSNNNWRRRIGGRGRRDLNESLAETDGRMTDSEVASSAPPAMSDSLSDISSRQVIDETMSDLGQDLNCTNDATIQVANEIDFLSSTEAEPEPPVPPQPAVIRRRRFFPNMFA